MNRIADVIAKVVLYVNRSGNELLVFEHVDVDAGIQVPKGTVERNETLEHAERRELFEEAGLQANNTLRFIGAMPYLSEQWNFFAMSADAFTPDTWQRTVVGAGEDNGMRFRFFWLPLTPTPNLAGDQDQGLRFLQGEK